MGTNGTLKRTHPSHGELEQKLQALSELTTRIRMASRFGFSHGESRDLYRTLGYKQNLTSTDYINQWKRQDIARAIVDRPVKKTWEGPVFVSESTEEHETELERRYKELDRKLGLKTKMMRVDRLAQLGQYAILLLGFDDSNPMTWSQPVTPGPRELKYVKVVSQQHAEVSAWEQAQDNERYGLPRLYKIHLRKPGTQDSTVSLNVHHSRVIHVTPDLLEDEIEGEPIIKTAFNRLKDIEKLVGGSAEMYWRGARPGYSGKADPDYKISTDVEGRIKEQLEEYENDLRRFLITEGIDLQALQQAIHDPKGHVEVQIQMLSALTGIPMRILLGSEQGSLASSQDEANYKEYIQSRREELAEPGIIRPFVDRLIQFEALPKPIDEVEGYSITWSDLFTMKEKEKAEIGRDRAQALANYVREPHAETLVPFEGFLRYVLRMDDDEVDHLLELSEGQIEDMLQEEAEIEDQLETGTSMGE